MMKDWLLYCVWFLCLLEPSRSQQTLYVTNLPAIAKLVPCASSGFIYAVHSLTDDCNISDAPVTYASCACLKNQNSVSASRQIAYWVKLECSSTATDDVSSALAVFSDYCAAVTPPAASAAPTPASSAAPPPASSAAPPPATSAVPPPATSTAPPTTITTSHLSATSVAYLTNIPAAATLVPCASTGFVYAVNSITSDCPPLAGPTAQASCACLKDQNSVAVSQYIVSRVALECSSTATEDINSAVSVFSDYCRNGAIGAAASSFQPVITSIGPMSAIQYLASLAPCASTAFTIAVNRVTSVCDAGAVPTAFANCACANATNSASLSDHIVERVEYYCSSTATADITSALAIFSSFCVLAGGASGPVTAATTGSGGVTCEFRSIYFHLTRTDPLSKLSVPVHPQHPLQRRTRVLRRPGELAAVAGGIARVTRLPWELALESAYLLQLPPF